MMQKKRLERVFIFSRKANAIAALLLLRTRSRVRFRCDQARGGNSVISTEGRVEVQGYSQ